MMNKKLFVFGCSYATGEELLMHQLKDIDQYRFETRQDPRKFFKKLSIENLEQTYEQIKEDQKKIAWPQLLADRLGYDCVNLAESGNSLDKMLFQLYEQIYQGNIDQEDIVIVSLTKATRNAVFDTTVESFQLPSLYWPVKTLLGVKDTGDMKPVISEETDKALITWFTDDRVLWDYIKNLQAIKNISQFFNLHIVPAMKNDIKSNIPLLQKIYEDCSKGFLTHTGLDDCSEGRLAWGHPDAVAHEVYSKVLYKELTK